MKIALVGPEIEENLSLRTIAASAIEAGHEVRLFDFHRAEQVGSVAAAITAWSPDLAGLSMIFTARSREYVALANQLRVAGFGGHLTAGGHFAAFNAQTLMREVPSFDSIVHGEGEEAVVSLVDNLEELAKVPGLTWRAGADLHTNPSAGNLADLDARPWPLRPARFHTYLGYPIGNVLSGRGCYANCHFCSINAWHRVNGGKRFRQRAVEAVADEMAHLYFDRGVRIFNFQDDNFFLPTPAQNLERFGALEAALEDRGVGKIGVQAKARPDSIDPDVITQLQSLGLFRLFLGVETDAVVGLRTLGRGILRQQNHDALALLRDREIHTCFNLLMFDPESTVETIAQNVAFMRAQDYFPLNFCRTEVYAGTALHHRLRDEGRLRGDYFGYWYAIADPRAELAYQTFRAVFTPRNFSQGGMHHESMKIDYKFHILAHFHPEVASPDLEHRVKQAVSELNRDSADLMDAVCAYAADEADPHTASRRLEQMPVGYEDSSHRAGELVARLSEQRATFDRVIARRYAALDREIEGLAEAARRRPKAQSRNPWRAAAASAAAAILLSNPGCGGGQTHMCEMAPPPNEVGSQARVTPADQARVETKVREFVYAELLPEAQTRGMWDTQFTLRLTLDAEGRVTSYELPSSSKVTPEYREVLEQAVPQWQFGPLERGGATDVLIQLPPPAAIPIEEDTHMCEMAPPPNGPLEQPEPPPQDSSEADEPPPNPRYHKMQRTYVQKFVSTKAHQQLAEIAKVHGVMGRGLKLTLELTGEGSVADFSLADPSGNDMNDTAIAEAIAPVVRAWNFSRVSKADTFVVDLIFPVTPEPADDDSAKGRLIEDRDTHMCEMAPPPNGPDYEPGLIREPEVK